MYQTNNMHIYIARHTTDMALHLALHPTPQKHEEIIWEERKNMKPDSVITDTVRNQMTNKT